MLIEHSGKKKPSSSSSPPQYLVCSLATDLMTDPSAMMFFLIVRNAEMQKA